MKAMSNFKNSLDKVVISGNSSSDATLGQGLIVSNTQEVEVTIKRPNSLHFRLFDGLNNRYMYLHDGSLTLSDTKTNVYGQAEVPVGINAGLNQAIKNYHIDLPLMDLMLADTFAALIGPEDQVLYITDKARIRGIDCHHIVVRTPDVDVQLWVQEGSTPLLRRTMITAKWEGGAPRFVAEMYWDTNPVIDPRRFEFKPAEGASRIEMIRAEEN
jgi:hypothetical protein